ncbi:prepilin-type N-terminal cleavage/methylation domain-containing protein [Calidithermus roseus]|uniref:Type IV pilus modification protein PilV n=1 Tax=Calidithermus roseus TaxID=1644118 RepID=A0A399EJR0_9DEIN|nr:prepilin-type N-terminal cleavage/methylation domain-containing protein [Calidithermus roseus]RIH84897.1 type IV pilus modification protein PilV [Calidithermus roseus]
MRKTQGITLVELLIALAILAIAFTALLFSQLSNLRASAQTRYASETKAAATRVLEALQAEVTKTVEVSSTTATYYDATVTFGSTTKYISYLFLDYYYRCPSTVTPTSPGTRTNLRPLSDLTYGNSSGGVACAGGKTNLPAALQNSLGSSISSVDWRIVGEAGITGEGVVSITVSAQHLRGPRITLINRITCYDVYPSPTSDAPIPCPTPTTAGGGR